MPRRGLLFIVGAACLAAGIALLVTGLLNVFNGDDGPPASDAPIIRVGDLFTPTPITTESSPTSTPIPPLGDGPYEFVIEKIGVDAPVRTYGLDEDAVPEIPTGSDAADVVAWYEFTAKPGTGSNAVFAGHVTWFGDGVFYNLANVDTGDEIKLQGQDGTELVYSVSDIFRVLASDPDARNVMFATSSDIMTIVTCDGGFTPTDDPITGGEYDHRLVIRADLVSVTQGTGAG